jgi:hypothetical protein
MDIFPRTEMTTKIISTYSLVRKISKTNSRDQSDAIVPYGDDRTGRASLECLLVCYVPSNQLV